MNPSIDRLHALLSDAAEKSLHERVPLLEEAVELADAVGLPSDRVGVRIALAEAYAFSGHPQGVLVPFAWLRERFDARDPALDDDDRRAILWVNKWIPKQLASHPEVPLHQVHAALDDMRRRYRRARQPQGPVLGATYSVEQLVHGDRAADAAFRAWVTAPRSELSDCEACEPTQRARHLAALGRHADAVAEVDPVLAGDLTCEAQPESAICAVLGSLVVLGRSEEAGRLHTVAWRRVRDEPGHTGLVADLIAFCARTGNPGRGVQLLSHRLADLSAPASPIDGMLLAAAAARLVTPLVASDHGEHVLTAPSGQRCTVAELADRLPGEALALAAAFDVRNGTNALGDRVCDLLTAADLGPVDLGALGREELITAELLGASAHPDAPDLTGLADLGTRELADAGDRATRYCGDQAERAVADAWLAGRDVRLADAEAAGPWEQEACAHLDRLVAAGAPDPTAAKEFTIASAERYRRIGQTGQALLSEQRLALVTGDADGVRAAADEIERLGTPEELVRSRSRLAFVTGDPDESERLLDSLAPYLNLPAIGEARVSVAAALLNRPAGGPEERVADLDRALGLLTSGEQPAITVELLRARADVLRFLERTDEAFSDLDKAIETARTAGATGQWLESRGDRADAVAGREGPGVAEALFARIAADAEAAGANEVAVGLRTAQSGCLAELDRVGEAAEIAEQGLALLAGDDIRTALAALRASECADPVLELGHARELAARAVRGFATEPDHPFGSRALAHLAELQWRSDDSAQALVTYDAARAQAMATNQSDVVAAMHRWRVWPVLALDGLDAALRELDAGEAAISALESRVLTDPEVRVALEAWDADAERLILSTVRARVLGASDRPREGLAALGDAEAAFRASGDEDSAALARELHNALTADAAAQDKAAREAPAVEAAGAESGRERPARPGLWRRLFGGDNGR